MGHKFADIAFTDEVKKVQQQRGSRAGYAGWESKDDFNHVLSEREASFIAMRDSLYMASVSETDWPYVQHRGGPVGFMRVLDGKTLGFADYRGNRQYVSQGNFAKNDRVSLIFMDYPNQRRLKILGRVSAVEPEDLTTLSRLKVAGYDGPVERGFLIHVEAFDWNCPKYITPRYTEADMQSLLTPLVEENQSLKAALNTKPVNQVLGNGPMPLVITSIRQLTPKIRVYEFRDPDGKDLPKIIAGSHLQLPVILENDEQSVRNYSICSNPSRRDVYEVAVLREDEGTGGSKAIHQQYQLGQSFACQWPKNHFESHSDARPAILIAGGIGITPIKSMAQDFKFRGIDFTLHYAGRNKNEMAFRDSLQRAFTQRIHIYSADENKRMDIEQIIKNAPADAVFYVCGPNRLIDGFVAEAQMQNIESQRVYFERFTTPIEKNAKEVTITLQRSQKQLTVAEDDTLLDAMLALGVAIPFSCKTGSCRTCAVKVLEGEAQHLDSVLSEVDRTQHKLMCPCVSRANTDTLILDI